MGSEFGNDYITISDDDGNEFDLEHLDTAEIDGKIYMAFLPADMDEDDEDFGLIILSAIVRDGEEVLATLDNDEELSMVYEFFIERLTEDPEEV